MQWIGHQRYIYNAKVREERYFRAFQRRFVGCAGMRAPIDQQYSQFITEDTAWLREVPSQVLRNGAVRFAQAYSRYFKGLAGRPTTKGKGATRSVWLTREVFSLTLAEEGERWGALQLGTRKHPVGSLPVRFHRKVPAGPASITLSVEGNRWYVSFCADDGLTEPSREDVGERLAQLGETVLHEITCGIDRNTPAGQQFACSDGTVHGYTPRQLQRMKQKARRTRRYQRQLARRRPGSCGWKKAKRRIAAHHRYTKNVRREVAHQASRALVNTPQHQVFAFEDLKIANMVRRPRAVQSPDGRWLHNRARAKAGLNRSILASAWGMLYSFTYYKAQRAGKLVVKVPAAGTSQECRLCGHSHPGNRPSQAVFACQHCGHVENADFNATGSIQRRGVQVLVSGQWRGKPVKKTLRLRSTKVGQELSEPEASPPTPVETMVSRCRGNPAAHRSRKPETPATPPPGG